MTLPDTLYERFTPRERIALFYEAMGRRDHAEADRLIDTCPRKTYTMQDTAYCEGVRIVHDACVHALLMIAQAQCKAMALLGIIAAAAFGKEDEQVDHLDLSELIERYRLAECEIRGIWEAWREFCATAGVDPEAVMRAGWGSVPKCVTESLAGSVLEATELAELIEPDAEAKATALELLQGRWKVYLDRTGASAR